MNSHLLSILAAVAAWPLSGVQATGAADNALGATGSATNTVLYSDVRTENAWKRQVVMQDADGEFFNDEGQVGELARVTAADEAATNAQSVAASARVAMTNALARLDEAAAGMATNAVGLAVVIAPETSRTNLTMFVVDEWTDGETDTQLVWINRELDLEPNRYVVYEGYGLSQTSKVTWTSWSAPTNVTVNGRTWTGCRKCTVSRPAWAKDKTCLTNPNESKFGGANGFDFGDLVLTMGGTPLDTCILTNKADATDVIYFDNGFFKGHMTGGE